MCVKVAHRTEGVGWEDEAPAAVARRPPISFSATVVRTEGYPVILTSATALSSHTKPHTAMQRVANRNVKAWHGRQRMVLERWKNPKLSCRTCEYGLQSRRGESAGVAKRPRERSPTRNPYRYDSQPFYVAVPHSHSHTLSMRVVGTAGRAHAEQDVFVEEVSDHAADALVAPAAVVQQQAL
jgi:hypothetical protein